MEIRALGSLRLFIYNNVVCKFHTLLLLSNFVVISELNANNVDLAQTPRSAASDLGLCCLPLSHLWDARHKWVHVLLLFHSKAQTSN